MHVFRPDLAKSCVLPELVELTNGQKSIVRVNVAALETIASVVPHLPQEVVRTSVVPLVQSFCQQALSNGSSSLKGVAGLLGGMCILTLLCMRYAYHQFTCTCA